ncbi:MAG: ROK family protein [Clostridia bacterium]|nr:ROK family protein [Clostridia bacterium]
MYIISIVIEKERTEAALFDKEYKLLLKKTGELEDAAKLCGALISESGISHADIDYVGIAADSSLVSPCSVASELEKSIGLKCLPTTLTDARALGEAYGLEDASTLVMLKIDEKIECGIIIDKKAYTGANNQGKSIAHTVINFDGFECSCGNRGCFEAYACNSGLNRIAAESGVDGAGALTHKQLFEMNTPEAKQAQMLYVKYLATGITNIINLFQPRYLVLDGPFTEVGDALMNPMMDIVLREQYTHSMSNKGEVRFADVKSDTALIGAALLGR